MLLSALVLTLASTNAPVTAPRPMQDRREQVTASYHELFAARDAEGMQKLWKQNEGLVLQTIDADLEGSLAKWEADPKTPKEDLQALHARALFGAYCASKAFGRPVFLDYASSFVGWTDNQKRDFRDGQRVYGRAVQELEDGQIEVALEAARETVLRALPLGDWWGTAMGYGAQGAALQRLGELEDALGAYSRARLLNADLGLQFAEYRNLQGMLSCTRALERWQRAVVVAEAVVVYARGFEDEQGVREGLAARMEIEGKLGLKEASEKSRRELEALDEK